MSSMSLNFLRPLNNGKNEHISWSRTSVQQAGRDKPFSDEKPNLTKQDL